MTSEHKAAMEGLLRVAGAWQYKAVVGVYAEYVYPKQLVAKRLMHERFVMITGVSKKNEQLWLKRATAHVDQIRYGPGGSLVIDWE
jgi:hypothetical protein